MSNTKVAILCLSHHKGGMELDAIRHTKLFKKHGIDALLICKSDTFLEEKAKTQNVEHFSIAFRSKLSLNLIRELRSVIKKEQITTLVFFGASEIKSIYFAVKGTNCKVIVRHGTTKSTSKKDFLHRIFYSCVSNYVAISEHLHRNALAILPATSSQTVTIYPSIDTTSIYPNAPKSPTFVFVGRVERGKGIYDAVTALSNANIPEENKKLTIVGPYNNNVKNELLDLVRDNRVELVFTGYTDNVSQHYIENAFFLFPSYGEGFGNVMLEAMNYGLACITYNNTIFPEFMALGFEDLYQAQDKNIIDLADKIELATSNFIVSKENTHKDILLSNFSEATCISKWKEILL
ncbi:glycosyltransferase family 4 protein [Vibrio hannami]|uniref:glycosyltransferase family 4 protein n=1 Tax=Vibrio hannami TaxID=2717094 RepID=UPI0024102279|nr:glycosyltransferase family 4 protein [Vibrio hannami]MDG3086918.1 glycosyltransferase family 4 protein [Vibrio hannami]